MHLLRPLSLIAAALFLGTAATAQGHTQTVRGTVVDSDTREPLIGASVVVPGSDPLIGGTTDLDGRFAPEHVPGGRIDVQARMMGCEEQVRTNLLVNSAKGQDLDVRRERPL